jgi:hypothetical protein
VVTAFKGQIRTAQKILVGKSKQKAERRKNIFQRSGEF